MDNFESLAEEHHIDFVFESEMPSLKLWVDADKLEKIVFNLLSNAFKFTCSGGRVDVSVSLVEGQDSREMLEIRVVDTGVGIKEENRERISNVFIKWIIRI